MSEDPAGKPTPPKRLEQIKHGLHIAVIVLLIAIAARIVQRSFADVIVIEPISVPKSLADNGYTGEAMAGRLAAELDDISHARKSLLEPGLMVAGDAVNRQPGLSPMSDRPALKLPERDVLQDVEVPETKLSVKTFIELSRYLIGSQPSTIKGTLIQESDDTLRLTVEVHSTRHDINTRRTFRNKKNQLGVLLTDAAHFSVEQFMPYAEALYLMNSNRWDPAPALALARRTIRSPQCDDKCRSMMYVLQGQLLITPENVLWSRERVNASYQEALKFDPKNVAAFVSMAYELADEGQYAKADAVLSRLLVHDPKNVDLLVALGWVRQKKAESLLMQRRQPAALAAFNTARVTYEKALAKDPSLAACEAGIGEIDYQTGDWDDGEQHFEIAIALEPDNPQHLLSYAQTVANLKDPDPADHLPHQEEAWGLAVRGMKAMPGTASIYLPVLRQILEENPPHVNEKTAMDDIESALRAHPDSADLHYVAYGFASIFHDEKRKKVEICKTLTLDPQRFGPYETCENP